MKRFLVSKNESRRLSFIRQIKGKKIAIYNKKSDLLKEFDLSISLADLNRNHIYLETLAKVDGNTSVVLIDILIKAGVYVNPYGKVYAFTEAAKTTYVIDTFAFKFTEKSIFRPFLFIDPNILGSSLGEFYNTGIYKHFEENTVETYYKKVKPHIIMDVDPIEVEVIKFKPTKQEVRDYEKLKKKIIIDDEEPKAKIINTLIKYVDGLESKKKVVDKFKSTNSYFVKSNNPRNKFKVYEALASPDIKKVTFVSSGIFGADEIELSKTKKAIERHNDLIYKILGKDG